MNIYTELSIEGYERVVRCDNAEVGFTAWIAVHDTTLGPALGGCRVWNYDNDDQALTDALRLGKGMTYKNALARLALGGGKSVVRADLGKISRTELFRHFGRFVDSLGGTYITAEDVNSTLADMEIVKRVTPHVATVGASGNPSPFTAYGVYCAIKACVRHHLQREELGGLRVAIQGVGETGGRVAKMLFADGCRIVAADINARNLASLAREIAFETVPVETIYDADCDVFSPCALGGILNRDTIARLQCKIVAGSANNQLLEEEDGERLRDRHILYAPDYAANAGGVINISCEMGRPYDAVEARRQTARIGECITRILDISERQGLATNRVANGMAERIIAEKKRTTAASPRHA